MKNRWNIGAIAFLLGLFSGHAYAQTNSTNIDGVIVKNVSCNYGDVLLNVSNRTNQSVSGTLVMTIFDSDGDPIDNGRKSFNVGPVSGDRLIRKGFSCSTAKKFTFRIE